MRLSFLSLIVIALVASSVTAASAFNYASMSRSVGAAIVTDNGNAYLSIEGEEDVYECFMTFTNGKFEITFNSGTACTTGTGVNPDSIYMFSDVLKITNKGAKALTGLWLNTTDATIQTKTATSVGTNMAAAPPSGWSSNTAVGALNIGASVYVSFKIDTDTTNLHTGNTPLSKTLTIEARATN